MLKPLHCWEISSQLFTQLSSVLLCHCTVVLFKTLFRCWSWPLLGVLPSGSCLVGSTRWLLCFYATGYLRLPRMHGVAEMTMWITNLEHCSHARPTCPTDSPPCRWSYYFQHLSETGNTSITDIHVLTVIPIPFSDPPSFSCSVSPPQLSVHPLEVMDWLNACLSVGNEPANVANWACSIFICKPANHWLWRLLCARRHICFLSKSQTERKMSGEYKSISRLFQVFISPSLCFSLSLMIPFLHRPFHPLSHTLGLFSATIVLALSLLISSSFILLIYLSVCTTIITAQRRTDVMKRYQSQTDWQMLHELALGRMGRSESLRVFRD